MNFYKLQNVVQEYAWGSHAFIADLLNISVVDTPRAELWMSAHPKAPSKICDTDYDLLTLINSDPQRILGEDTAEKFENKLPFLFKVLSASKPLSIQAHPNLKQAKAGFKKENKEEIPLTSAYRNYKDNNHKPELICALTPFTAMCGFRSPTDIKQLLNQYGMADILPKYHTLGTSEDALKNFFSTVMKSDSVIVRKWISILIKNISKEPKQKHNKLIVYWIQKLNEFYPGDVGVLAPILLNIVELQPGEALYLEAGILHAYLHGNGIEIMANSDNVLRGGLTPKHVDVPELLGTLIFRGGDLKVIKPKKNINSEMTYHTAASEFELSKIVLTRNTKNSFHPKGPEIILCTAGECFISTGNEQLSVSKGDSFFISAECKCYALIGNAQLFRAVIPGKQR